MHAVSVLFLGGLPGLYLFLEGNQLRRQKLDEQGYDPVGVVEASSAESAVERFIAYSEIAFFPAPVVNEELTSVRTRPASTPTPAFGLFSDHGI